MIKIVSLSRLKSLAILLIVSPLLTAPKAHAACVVDEDLSQFCGKGSWAVPIGWTPNAPYRYRLYKTSTVQNTLKGCDMYIKIVKAECQPPRPVYGLFYDNKGMGVQIYQLKVEKTMPAMTKNMPDFVTYFQYATPTPLTNPFLPQKKKYIPEGRIPRSAAR